MAILDAEIKSIIKINQTVKLFKIKLNEKITFNPGQFGTCMFKINNKSINRSYSFGSKEYENIDEIEFYIRLNTKGEVTPFLFSQKEGFKFKLIAPLGSMIIPDEINVEKEIIFLATGTGISPFRSMIKKNLDNNKKVTLIFGCRSEEDILLRDEFENLMNENKNFKFIITISNSNEKWKGNIGYVQDFIDKDYKNKIFVICGNPFMTKDVLNKLKNNNVEDKNIIYEKWN